MERCGSEWGLEVEACLAGLALENGIYRPKYSSPKT